LANGNQFWTNFDLILAFNFAGGIECRIFLPNTVRWQSFAWRKKFDEIYHGWRPKKFLSQNYFPSPHNASAAALQTAKA
jgi:hypothetical protein